jgi:hypothetical protein
MKYSLVSRKAQKKDRETVDFAERLRTLSDRRFGAIGVDTKIDSEVSAPMTRTNAGIEPRTSEVSMD